MKHVRMLGACLIVVGATGGAIAQPALAKSPYIFKENIAKLMSPFTGCPYNQPEVGGCVYAKSESGEFKAGNVMVPLKKPIVLQGAFRENGETGAQEFVGAEHGSTLTPVEQTVPGGLSALIDPSLLSGEILAAYNAAAHSKVTATIELAGSPSAIVLNEEHLLEGSNETAIGLPVKVKLTNAFLGSNCYVGSDSEPIIVDLVSGTSGALKGKLGEPTTDKEGIILTIKGDTIVNNTYTVPGVQGCGEAASWRAQVDAAGNAKSGLPAEAGINSAVINGQLKQSGADLVQAFFEGGEEGLCIYLRGNVPTCHLTS